MNREWTPINANNLKTELTEEKKDIIKMNRNEINIEITEIKLSVLFVLLAKSKRSEVWFVADFRVNSC